MTSKGGDVVLTSPGGVEKPKGLLDALAEIQQYYVVERSSQSVSEDFLTLKGKLAFFEVGFKSTFLTGLLCVLLTPLALGVLNSYIPVFGTTELTSFDKVFTMVFAFSFTIGYTFFVASISRYYIGTLTTASIRNLFGGLVTGSLCKVVFAFLIYYTAYHFLLDPYHFGAFCQALMPSDRPDLAQRLYAAGIMFRSVMLPSFWWVFAGGVAMIVIPGLSILIRSRKTRRALKTEETKGLRQSETASV